MRPAFGTRPAPAATRRSPSWCTGRHQNAVAATVSLARMLDEADEFCRSGNHLLTLATPPELLAFRRWYLGEFNAQLQGQSPLPWPEADRQQLVASPTLRGPQS